MATRQFVTFYLGNDLFGLDILLVREINRNLDITHVDRAPEYVRGLLNLRGQIVTVLDLGVRLGLDLLEIGKTSSCIVLKTAAELERSEAAALLEDGTSTDLVGLLVDKIGDVVEVDSEDIEPPPSHASGVAGRYLDGVIKLKDTLLVTIKTSEVLSLDPAAARV